MTENVLPSDAVPVDPPNPDISVPAAVPEAAVDDEPTAVPAEASTPDEEPSAVPPPPPPSKKHWYVVKVQSGREESIKEAIERRVKIEGLEEFYGQIVIPAKSVTEMRHGKRVTKEQKLFPGYLVAEVEYNDRILYLFRETSGVGDFVGGGINKPPPPLAPHEVARMTGLKHEGPVEEKIKPIFDKGDKVKVTDGAFAGMEGEVKEIMEAKGQVKVEVTIFGRPVSLELEYWQVEAV
jgi:transcriptional antiterminator NusG